MDEKKLRKRFKKAIASIDTIATDMIETVDYEYHDRRDVSIVIEHGEFTSLCPRTGLPDFGTITIHYIPNRKIIELRSLKFYFLQYRNAGVFYEHVVNKILDDLVPLLEPHMMEITGNFNVRGGFSTTTSVEYNARYEEKHPLPAQDADPDPGD